MSESSFLANKKRCIAEVESSLSLLLEAHGFGAEPIRFETEQRDFTEWIRDRRWKQDVIRLHSRPLGEILGLGVEVRMPDIPDKLAMFDGRAANHVLGRRGYYVPYGTGPVARWRTRALIRRISRDCLAVLEWFESSASPTAALARLRTGETNGCGSEGRAYSNTERYLEALLDAPKG